MKIKSLKINGFGKLQKREINFEKGINIFYGENESGKSTLLKFILAMFFGLSKNKNGKFMSDYERYLPWQESEFSGKIKYELDNGKTYEIFREFKKKVPKIYDEYFEEVSNQFEIDKTNGNQFFKEQTKVDEELFLSTVVTEQEQVKLDEKTQTTLVQKIANFMDTGENELSFQKIIQKLNKKELEEIGTIRSQERPINRIITRIQEIEEEKEYLIKYKEERYQIDEKRKEIGENIREQEDLLALVKEWKNHKEKEEIAVEKQKAKNELINEYEKKIQEQKKTSTINTHQKESKRLEIISIILALVSIIVLTVIPNKIIGIMGIVIAIGMIGIHIANKKRKQKSKKNMLNKEIEALQEALRVQKEEQIKFEKQLEEQRNLNKEKLKKRYSSKLGINKIEEILQKREMNYELDALQNHLNKNKISMAQIELESKQIVSKLENLNNLEEELENLEEEKQELDFEKEAIAIARQEIEKAYQMMKGTVTPKFTKNFGKMIQRISNGSYQKVQFDEKNGLTVEIENGDYISAKQLSIGTIDQLYLALRLGIAKEISKETLPIILDEAFAYYDEKRLENSLLFINEFFADRQLFLITCTNREREILEKNKIPYHMVKL